MSLDTGTAAPDKPDGEPNAERVAGTGATIVVDQEHLEEHLEEMQRADAKSDRRLAFLVFLATLAGNLIALIASLADASSMVGPVLDLADPMPAISVAGSNTILGAELKLASDWVAEFQALNTATLELPIAGAVERKIRFAVDPVGTLAGIELASQGSVQLLAASEALNDQDVGKLSAEGVTIHCAAPIGYDVIAFVTDITNELTRPLTREEIRGILAGSIRSWSELGGKGGPIRVYARAGSGTTDLVLRAYLGTPEVPSHMIDCGSQAECLNQTLSTPGSLYWVSSAWLRTQPSNYLRPVLIALAPEAADPLSPQFDPADYPPELVRPLYMYVLQGTQRDDRTEALSVEFLEYVRGVQGQKILETHRFYTYFDPPPGVTLDLPPGFGLREDGPPVVCRDSSAQARALSRR